MNVIDKEVLRRIADTHRKCIFPPYDEIYNIIGFDALYLLLEVHSGRQMYIPSVKNTFLGCVVEGIKEEYTGYNMGELAIKYDVSKNFVRKCVSTEKYKTKERKNYE